MASQKMNYTTKIACLKAIYEFFDEFIKGLPMACEPGCDVCCSVNVAVTSLEVDYMVDHMDMTQKSNLENILPEILLEPHYRPSYTTNEMAAACLNMQDELPKERSEHGKGKCPLLNHGLCNIYDYRPFACRAMLSQTKCASDTSAYMSDFLVTVALSIYQIIEQLDEGNPYGNMLDLLAKSLNIESEHNPLITCKPLPGFVPMPEEKGRFNSFLKRLYRKKVGETETSLGEILGLPSTLSI